MLWEKIKSFFKKKGNPDWEKNFNEETRQRSAETRRLQYEMAQLRKQVDLKQELQDMRTFLSGDVEQKKGPEDMFMEIVMNKIMGSAVPQQHLSSSTSLGTSDRDTELKAIAEKVAAVVPSQYIPVIAGYSDEELIKIKNFMIEVKKGV